MAISIEDFRENFIGEITDFAREERIHVDEAFINEISEILQDEGFITNELNPDFQWIVNEGTKRYKSMHIDAGGFDPATNTLNLVYCDFNQEEPIVLNTEKINNIASKMEDFFVNTLKGYFKDSNFNEAIQVIEFARDIMRSSEEIGKIKLFLLTTNAIGSRVKSKRDPIVIDNRKYDVEFYIIDVPTIYNIRSAGREKEDIVINIEDYNANIPCIKADIDTNEYESYLAIVPGEFLADIYCEYDSRLLEDNVRSFLNVNGAVNKGIRGTILNCKNRFFTYNNGISTTAKEVEIVNDPEKGFLIKKLVGFQIINGGQTTASLARAKIKDKADLSGIYVQMKLTVVKNRDDELVRLISKYANSQNKVTNADLNSNHPYYQRIEDFSHGDSRVMAPPVDGKTYYTIWFFERVRGQYEQPKMKMTKAEIDRYTLANPKSQKFTKTDLAKFLNTFDLLPNFVSWGADVNATKFYTEMSKKWDSDQTQFNKEYYKQLIAKAIMFKQTQKIISDQIWYQENKAYRAQLVTYSLAKLQSCSNDLKRSIDFDWIWRYQKMPDCLVEEIEKISKLVFNISHDPNRSYDNIGEYFKKDACWKKVKEAPYDLSEDSIDFLKSIEQVKEEKTIAKKDQKLTNISSAMIKMYELGERHWLLVQQKCQEQRLINEKEFKTLSSCIKSCRGQFNLGDNQVADLITLCQKVEELGIDTKLFK